MAPLPPPSKIIIAAAVLISGVCWYLSFSLSGGFWYLQWVAPIPILYLSLNVKAWPAFAFTFIAYLIGRLSWLPYLLSVLPAFLAIMFTLLLPLVFALLATTARKVVLNTPHWLSTFAFPVLFTSFEYLMFIFSRDGTIISIAYTQCNFLPVVQVASVTGIQGITFLLTLIPSAVAAMLYYRRQQIKIAPLLITVACITCVVLVFGIIRLSTNKQGAATTNIGMAAIDEHIYGDEYEPNTTAEIQIAQAYMQDVSVLASQGAQVAVLPEKATIVNDSSHNTIQQMFMQAAITNHVSIVAGITKIKKGYYENNCWVFSAEGKLLADYQKVNLFEGEAADGFKPGDTIALFTMNGETQGTAICKDMDFQQFLLHYAKASPSVLYAPAWDFVKDGWLHSRMAIMRGVEGGYSIVRNAREGRLTISDYRGKVLYEASSELRTHTLLLGKAPHEQHTTIYSKTGDWFSYLNLIAAVWCIIMIARGRKRVNS